MVKEKGPESGRWCKQLVMNCEFKVQNSQHDSMLTCSIESRCSLNLQILQCVICEHILCKVVKQVIPKLLNNMCIHAHIVYIIYTYIHIYIYRCRCLHVCKYTCISQFSSACPAPCSPRNPQERPTKRFAGDIPRTDIPAPWRFDVYPETWWVLGNKK